jgi:tRNA dimethylallyltransferase
MEERGGVPHHLMDVWPMEHLVTVSEFQADARAAIDDALGRERVPVVVGGSGLFVSAVLDDLNFPGTDEEVRAKWEAELERVGPAALHVRLAEADPAAAAAILPSNGRRIVRALEVIELTGEPFVAEFPDPVGIYPTVRIGLEIPREILDERIALRVDAMFAAGFIDEVRELDALGLRQARTASRALGYSQVLAVLDGELSEGQAREEIIVATRRFARRQQRWFRRDSRIRWIDYDSATAVDEALSLWETST